MASEEQALSIIAKTTDYLIETCHELVEDGMPAEVILACLIHVTRVYQDKCAIPLDRIVKALETAKEGEDSTCTT